MNLKTKCFPYLVKISFIFLVRSPKSTHVNTLRKLFSWC